MEHGRARSRSTSTDWCYVARAPFGNGKPVSRSNGGRWSAWDSPSTSAQAAVLAEFGREGRLGCAGFEMDADWARRMPPTLATNFILRGAHLHVPFDLGIAVPWTPRSRYGDASVGVLMRLILEIDHD